MKKILIMILLIISAGQASFAKIKIIVSYPYIKDITEKIGGDKITITVFSKGDWDPHYVVPRPSYIAKARDADLLIINGAQLEIGWIPPIINQANNPKIMPGQNGFLDLSNHIKLLSVPDNVSRSMGDVHPDGNPHFQLDPLNLPVIASAITVKLAALDPENASFYQKNYEEFISKWNIKEKEWAVKMKSLKGVRVIEYHRLYEYFLLRYGLLDSGTIEPLPGIPPTSRHVEDLLHLIKRDDVKFILQDVYHSKDSAKYLSKKSGIRMIILPHDVDAVGEAKDVFSLFDEIVRRLTK